MAIKLNMKINCQAEVVKAGTATTFKGPLDSLSNEQAKEERGIYAFNLDKYRQAWQWQRCVEPKGLLLCCTTLQNVFALCMWGSIVAQLQWERYCLTAPETQLRS